MSQLAKIEQQLAQAGSLKSALSLDFVEKTFINNYEKITGRKDGQQKFQGEVFALMDLANENQAIAACDRFSMFAALVKAGATGLSFMDQKLYAIPYGKTLKVQVSTHGKRELLGRMPGVKRVHEGQVVIKGDVFEHDKLNNKVVSHISKGLHPVKLENILASYVRIEYTDKSVIDTVVSIEEIIQAKNKSKAGGSGPWASWPGEMAKKVAYNRAYKLYYVKPEGIFDYANEVEGDSVDTEFTTVPESTTVTTTDGEQVDRESGEVLQVEEEQPKPKATSGKSFLD